MENNGEGIDGIRSVILRRSEASGMGLGFSIMGGAGYDFPPVIYGIEKDSPAARSGVVRNYYTSLIQSLKVCVRKLGLQFVCFYVRSLKLETSFWQ